MFHKLHLYSSDTSFNGIITYQNRIQTWHRATKSIGNFNGKVMSRVNKARMTTPISKVKLLYNGYGKKLLASETNYVSVSNLSYYSKRYVN